LFSALTVLKHSAIALVSLLALRTNRQHQDQPERGVMAVQRHIAVSAFA
jgi:hypothetical protein